MKIFITGNKGFIGSALSKELSKNHEVFGCDKEFDLTENCLDVSDYDLVIHCAARLGVENISNDSKILTDNYYIDFNVINACLKHNKKIVYFSTSEIFGNNDECYNDSDFQILNNHRGFYASQKLNSELFIKSNFDDYLIIRPFNIVGMKNDHSVLTKMIKDAKEKGTIYADETCRSFCHIEDFTKILIDLIENQEKGCYNIGNRETYIEMYQLGLMISEILDNNINIIRYKDLYNSKITERNLINDFNCKYREIEDIIRKMLKEYKNDGNNRNN